MKALVGAFNQEKVLVGAFSVIVQAVVEPMDRFTSLLMTHNPCHFTRDLSFMRRVQNKHGLKLGMKTNHQKHFKDRNGMCM